MSNPDMFKYEWIWEKSYSTGFMNANKMPMRNIEEVIVFYKNLPIYNPQGIVEVNKKQNRKRDKETTIYSDMGLKDGEYNQKYSNYPTQIIKTDKKEKTVHPTQKPVALFEYLIKTYTNEGDLVLDNCAGSGTTGVACKNLNRNYILIEKEPEYCKIAQARINSLPKLLL
jgi:site-specific DNA-methyltransferase (adenine-specific)